jgi:hypothetical protein
MQNVHVILCPGMPWRKQLPQFFGTSGRRQSCTHQKTQIFSNTDVRASNVALCNMLIYYSAVWLAPCPTTKLEDCLLQAVHDWLFNVFASAPRYPEGVLSIRNRGTRHVIAAKDPFSVTIRTILLIFMLPLQVYSSYSTCLRLLVLFCKLLLTWRWPLKAETCRRRTNKVYYLIQLCLTDPHHHQHHSFSFL